MGSSFQGYIPDINFWGELFPLLFVFTDSWHLYLVIKLQSAVGHTTKPCMQSNDALSH